MGSRAHFKLAGLALLGLVFVLACGGGNAGSQVGTVATSTRRVPATKAAAAVKETVPPEVEPTATAKPKAQIYHAGDVVQVKDHTIVLNGADIAGGVLKANFTLENKGSDDVNVSSLLSFSAKDSEGVKLDGSYFDCGSSFDGTVLAGDKLKGDICWKVTDNPPFRIQYEANLFDSGAVVWEVTPAP